MKVIYVAGPYRSNGWNGIWSNIMEARGIARGLWVGGHAAICPHLNSMFMDGPDLESEQFILGDLEIIKKCDAMVMMDGWGLSPGAKREHGLARSIGIPVFYSAEEALEKLK